MLERKASERKKFLFWAIDLAMKAIIKQIHFGFELELYSQFEHTFVFTQLVEWYTQYE